MSPFEAVALVVGGLVALTAGGELLVRGTVVLARLLGLTPAMIGLTVVAVGTSFPELIIGITAAREGQPDIAVGNIVGTNIFNLFGVLGIGALVSPLAVQGTAVRREWPVMMAVSILFVVVALDGILSRTEGAFLVACYLVFLVYSIRIARRDIAADEAEHFNTEVTQRASMFTALRTSLVPVGFVLFGLLALMIGGSFIVAGAVVIAGMAGLSERVIALTVVAAGTSMPEIASTLVALRRQHSDVAIANLLGTNIFNILGVLGICALIAPTPIAPEILRFDVWWMLGAALILLPAMVTGYRITRREGSVFLLAYALYVWLLLR